MYRGQGKSNWRTKGLLHGLAGFGAGALFGAALGGVGSLMGSPLRGQLVGLLAIPAVVVGAAEVVGRGIPLPDRKRETPQRWMHAGPLLWPILNGGALGLGVSSRIGVWLWYAVPLSSLLSGDVMIGATIFGAYGLVRGGIPSLLFVRYRRATSSAVEFGLAMMSKNGLLTRLCGAQLFLLGVVVLLRGR